ncbi:MAG: hypothetical protein AAFZ15_34120 [Bacteroidota bacterium]
MVKRGPNEYLEEVLSQDKDDNIDLAKKSDKPRLCSNIGGEGHGRRRFIPLSLRGFRFWFSVSSQSQF